MPSLYQKYRPQKFSQISGQEHIVKTLSRAIEKKRVSHAYLFSGSRGTGKTTLARIFAKAINCLEPNIDQNRLAILEPCGHCKSCQEIASEKNLDILEIDAASHTGVDNIRQLKESIYTPPISLKYKIYIIDEAHMLSIGAFNALLKMLEEPPTHTIFILATTENHKIPQTIASRCQCFNFFQLSEKQIIERLEQIARKEKVTIEKEALEMIAIEAEGGMRDAESLLGQVIALQDQNITTEETEKILGIASEKNLIDFIENLLFRKNAKDSLEKLEILFQRGVHLKIFEKAIFSFLRKILIFQTNPNISPDKLPHFSQKQIESLKKIASQIETQEIIDLLDLLGKNYSLHKNSPLSQLPLELSIIEFCLDKEDSHSQTLGKSSTIKKQINSTEKENKLASFRQPEIFVQETDVNANIKKKKDNLDNPCANITIQDFLEQWPKILEEVKNYNHSIHAFLKNCIPCSIKNEKIVIKTRYEYHRNKLSQPECQLTVNSSIAKLFSGSWKTEFVFDKDLPVKLISEEKTSAQDQTKTSVQPESEEVDLLFETMRDLGGRIIEEKKEE